MAEMILELITVIALVGIVVQSIFFKEPSDSEDAAVDAVILGLNDGSDEHNF